MNKKILIRKTCQSLPAVTLALFLMSALGCSSGPSKTAQPAKTESPSPQVYKNDRQTSSPAPPVVSKPAEPEPKKSPQPPALSSSSEAARSAPKPPASKSSAKIPKRTYKKKKTPTTRQDNSLDALLGTTPTMTAQESSSGSSIRGLSPVSESYGRDHKIPDDILDSVRRMEEFEISDEEIERFRKAGKLMKPSP